MRAKFIEPMLLLRKEMLPEGSHWIYEMKFDGYRAIASKTRGRVHLRSRNGNDFLGPISFRDLISRMPEPQTATSMNRHSGPRIFLVLQNWGP